MLDNCRAYKGEAEVPHQHKGAIDGVGVVLGIEQRSDLAAVGGRRRAGGCPVVHALGELAGLAGRVVAHHIAVAVVA